MKLPAALQCSGFLVLRGELMIDYHGKENADDVQATAVSVKRTSKDCGPHHQNFGLPES
jgi:hypothetical protein